MDIKNIFVKESGVHYLWSGFVKKFKSLNSAGVVPQRVEAFYLYGNLKALRNETQACLSEFGSHRTKLYISSVLVQVKSNDNPLRGVSNFDRGISFFSFLSCFFLRLFRFPFLSFCDTYENTSKA